MNQVVRTLYQMRKIFQKWLISKYGNEGLLNKTVFLKPNIGYPKPSPYTTSIKLLHEIIRTLMESYPKEIIIGEGSTSKTTTQSNFEIVGLKKALKRYNITCLDLNTLEVSEVALPNGSIHYIPTLLKEMDLRISIPVVKFYYDEQGDTFLSNAVKNFFGLPPKIYYQKSLESYKRDSLHNNLQRSVVEIYQAVMHFSPFDYYICDGLKILYGEGETGKSFKWRKILLSDNAIEVDLKILELLKKPLPKYLRVLTNEETQDNR